MRMNKAMKEYLKAEQELRIATESKREWERATKTGKETTK